MQLRVKLAIKKGSAAVDAVAPPPASAPVAATLREHEEPSTPLSRIAFEAPSLELLPKDYSEEQPSHGAPTIKTFTASSVAQAMLMARADLGDDAILIQSKPLDAEPGSILKYQVTFGIVPGAATPRDAINELRPRSAPEPLRLAAASSTSLARAAAAVAAPAVSTVSSTLAPIAVSSTSTIAAAVKPPAVEVVRSASEQAAVARETERRIEKSGSPAVDTSEETEPTVVREAIESMRRELMCLQAALVKEAKTNVPANAEPTSKLCSMLIQQDVDRDLALRIATAVENRLAGNGPVSDDKERAALLPELSSLIKTGHNIASVKRPILLVGPPASGKTTILMKLAVEAGIRKGRPVQIISIDRGKSAVNRTLETIAGIFGADYRGVNSVQGLRFALKRERPADALVLIEATGVAPKEPLSEADLITALHAGDGVETHLVLSGAWHPANIRKAMSSFEMFNPAFLLFTMMDQAASFGTVVTEAERTALPLSYFGNAALGSGNLETASLTRLLNWMWKASPAQ